MRIFNIGFLTRLHPPYRLELAHPTFSGPVPFDVLFAGLSNNIYLHELRPPGKKIFFALSSSNCRPKKSKTQSQTLKSPNKKVFFIFFSREINPLIFCHFSCIHGFYIVCKICSSVIGSFIFYLLPDASGLELRSLIGNVSDKNFSPNFETSDHLMKFFTFFYFLFAVLLSELWN